MANGFGNNNFANNLLFQQPQVGGGVASLFPGVTDPALGGGQNASDLSALLNQQIAGPPQLGLLDQAQGVERLQNAAPPGIAGLPQLSQQAPSLQQSIAAPPQDALINGQALQQGGPAFNEFVPQPNQFQAAAPQTATDAGLGALLPEQDPRQRTLSGFDQRATNQPAFGGLPGSGLLPFDQGARLKAAPEQGEQVGQVQQPGGLEQGAQQVGNSFLGGAGNAFTGGTALAPGAPTLFGSTVGGAALAPAGIAAGALVGQQQLSGLFNALQGEDLGITEEAALAPLTGGFSFAFDSLFGGGGLFGSSKRKERKQREGAFGGVREAIGGDALQLAGGRSFDISDANKQIGENSIDTIYNVDQTRDGAAEAVADVQPFGHVIAGVGFGLEGEDFKRVADQLTGLFTNATLSGGDAKANATSIMNDIGMSPQILMDGILQLHADKKIDDNQRDVFMAHAQSFNANN